MKNFLMIVFLVGVVLGVCGFVSGEETKAEEAKIEEKKSLLRPPQFEQPKAGGTVDASFKVALESIPEGGSCVSVMQEQATILIHRDILEYLKIAKPAQANTEDERMATLHGRR